MSDILQDNGWTVATAHGPARKVAPLPNVSTIYVTEQDYVQNVDSFASLDLNTPHPTEPGFVLVQETPYEDFSAGAVKWTRVYAKVPDSWSEANGTYAYNFIGFLGIWGINVTVISGRPRYTYTVPVKVVRDYFLTGIGGLYATSLDIPLIPEQQYYITSVHFPVNELWDNPPFSNSSTPTRAVYEGWITTGSYIAVEASNIIRWMGNIFCRETKYVKAQ